MYLNQKSFIYLKQGRFSGYGFVDENSDFNHNEDFEHYLIPQKSSAYADRIIRRYLATEKNIVRLPLTTTENSTQDIFASWLS